MLSTRVFVLCRNDALRHRATGKLPQGKLETVTRETACHMVESGDARWTNGNQTAIMLETSGEWLPRLSAGYRVLQFVAPKWC